jgi:hypothetical protein
MDLLNTLSTQLGISNTEAQGVAGSVLQAVHSKVKEKAGDGPAAQLSAAVPELASWQSASEKMTSNSAFGMLSGLLGGGGGGELAGLITVLGKVGLDPSKAAIVAPIVHNFLKARLSPEMLGLVMKAVPFVISR